MIAIFAQDVVADDWHARHSGNKVEEAPQLADVEVCAVHRDVATAIIFICSIFTPAVFLQYVQYI